jgi:hypothetical protein
LSRHRFEAYLDKVFGFSDLVSALPEGRQFPQHAWKKVFDAVFLGAAMQISSLLQIEADCHDGALAKRIGPISDDTLGYSLERQSPEPVFALSCKMRIPVFFAAARLRNRLRREVDEAGSG